MDIYNILERLITLINEGPRLSVDPRSVDEWYERRVNRTLCDLARFSESQLPDALPSASHGQLVELQTKICDAGSHMHPIYLDPTRYRELARDLKALIDQRRGKTQ